jgi:hypothetical protein
MLQSELSVRRQALAQVPLVLKRLISSRITVSIPVSLFSIERSSVTASGFVSENLIGLPTVRYEPRKQLRASRAGLHVREVDDLDSVEWFAHNSCLLTHWLKVWLLMFLPRHRRRMPPVPSNRITFSSLRFADSDS